MFLVWENYGLSLPDQIAAYVHDKLSDNERVIVIEVLTVVRGWAEAGFMEYQAGKASRLIKVNGAPVGSAKKEGHLRLVGSAPALDTYQVKPV